MDRTITTVERLADWKREMKKFVRGVIKSKVFNANDGKANFIIEKEALESANTVTMCIISDDHFNYAEFNTEVSTRVFNKITPELFTKTIEQFNKLKNFAGMTVTFE